MKPIYLEMSAFGPFADKQCIHFNELGDNPLFLINGPTGAGKTTLLDAMTFALFNSTTGDRSGQNMRCDHAPNDQETSVVLIFSCGAHTYKVERSPTQTAKARRGDGETTRAASATLWRVQPDAATHDATQWQTSELLANKVNDVSQQAQALLGLNADQFRQVVVLPQGRFREFLLAKSSERENVLESLFQTQRFKLIEEALSQRALAVNRDYTTLKNELEQRLKDMGHPTIEAALAHLDELQPPLADAQAEHEHAKQQFSLAQTHYTQAEELNKRFVNLAELQNKLKHLAEQHNEMQQHQQQLKAHAQALHLQPFWQTFTQSKDALGLRQLAYNKAQVQAEQATAALNQTQAELKTVADHPARIEQLNLRLDELSRLVATVQQLQQLMAKLQQQAQAVTQASTQKTVAAENLAQLKTNHNQVTSELTALRERIKQHTNTEAQRTQLAHHQQLHDELNKRHAEVLTAQHAWLAAQAPLTVAQAATEQAQQARDSLFLRWYQEQAAALAQKLQPGQPCLVCGSTEHPAPAHLARQQDLVSQEQLDAAEALAQTKRRAEHQAQTALELAANNHTKAEQARNEIAKRVSQVIDTLAKPVACSATQHAASEPSANQQSDSTHSVSKHSVSKKAPAQDAEELLEELAAQLQLVQTQLREIEQRQHRERTQEAELEAMQAKLVNQIAQQEQALAEANTQLQDATQAHSNSASQLAALDKDGELRKREVTQITNEHQQIQTERDNLRLAHDKAQTQLKRAENHHTTAQSTLASALTEVTTATQTLNQAESRWHEKLSASPFADAEAFSQALLDQATADTLQQQVETYKNHVTQVQTGIDSETKAIGNQAQPDLAQLAEQRSQAATLEHEKLQAWQILYTEHKQLKDNIDKYQKRAAQSADLERNYAVLGRLAQTLAGNNNSRISLNRFVLAILLDDVLHEASQRLAQMTQGRYQLVRRREGGDARSHGGLELMIDDSHTGKQREVNTLSGGESFMAALALALGLSDVVQSYAGGIKIDTLFIDEGFGSLDSEALDQAINVLAHLRDNGRTIGIISHVSELKQRITKRIDVVRGIGGSSLRVGL